MNFNFKMLFILAITLPISMNSGQALAGRSDLRTVVVKQSGVKVQVQYLYDTWLKAYGTWTTGVSRPLTKSRKDYKIATTAMKKLIYKEPGCRSRKALIFLKGWGAYVEQKNMWSFKVRCTKCRGPSGLVSETYQ